MQLLGTLGVLLAQLLELLEVAQGALELQQEGMLDSCWVMVRPVFDWGARAGLRVEVVVLVLQGGESRGGRRGRSQRRGRDGARGG